VKNITPIRDLSPKYKCLANNVPMGEAPELILDSKSCLDGVLTLWSMKYEHWILSTDEQARHFLYWISDASKNVNLSNYSRFRFQAFVRARS